MANYKSKFTGPQVDNVIDLFNNKGLGSVFGIVLRNGSGQFEAAISAAEAEGGNELTLVTTGEKYIWNHITDDIRASIGQPNGLAQLDGSGTVPSMQLPSYVDDVIEVASFEDLPIVGETGKIYVTLDTNLTYRWSGSQYVEISKSLALGETEFTAYRGDRGALAYAHGVTNKGAAFQQGFYKIESNQEGHVISASPVIWGDLSALGAINGGSNSKSEVTIKPTTTSVYSIESVGAANVPTRLDMSKFDGGSLVFEQDENNETHFTLTYTAASHNSGFYTAGTAATMPTRTQVSGLWNGYESGIDNTFADAQTFTASS